MTTLRADADSFFKYKYLVIGVLATGYGLYCLYDAVIKYPAMWPRSDAYSQMREMVPDDGAFQRQWVAMASEKGWPEKAPYTTEQLTTNTIYSYFMGGLFTLVGIPALLTGLKCLGQWIEADEKSLVNAKGQRVEFDQIKSIDKSRWEKKGIAKLIYEEGGTEKSFVVDDLKFDREVADQIMNRVESAVGADKIVGGLSEVEYQENRKKAAAEKEAKRAALDAQEEGES